VRPRTRRKKWEEIAEFIGVSGVIKHAGRNIPCVVKEVVIGNGKKDGKPELQVVTEDNKRYPIKRFTPRPPQEPKVIR